MKASMICNVFWIRAANALPGKILFGGVLKKSKRLEPVKKIAESKESAAAVKVAKSVLEKAASLDQLEKLRGYRDEYIVQFKTKGQNGMSASRLQDYQAFVHKLDRAIEEQIRAVQGKHNHIL